MDTDVIPVDTEEWTQMTAAFQATSYHEHLKDYAEKRIAYLLDKELTDTNEILKCRGQLEELQHLLRPAFCSTLALLGLRARAERDRQNTEPREPLPSQPWWVDPPDIASERPVP
ncbi:MAG TPA: hypothetical protein VKB20_11865 [Steroidobacteraceae bacterium]|nr:hypothetical protein [Steroidobacteraceae bacterium]